MEDYEDRQPNPLRPITAEHFADLEHVGSTLTHMIGQAHNEALRTLPTTPIPGPKHNSGREYWPRAVRMDDLAHLRQRAGAIRSLLPDIRKGHTIDNALLPSLQQSPDLTTINIEPADNDEGSKPLSLPAQQSRNEDAGSKKGDIIRYRITPGKLWTLPPHHLCHKTEKSNPTATENKICHRQMK